MDGMRRGAVGGLAHVARAQMLLVLLLCLDSAASSQVTIAVANWTTGPLTNSTATYQTSINPKYRMDGAVGTSNISAVVFDNMGALPADNWRIVPWFVYPRLAVAQLEAPTSRGTTSCAAGWDFGTYIDPIIAAHFTASRGRPYVLNFATTPEWMWEKNVTIPPVNTRDGSYEKGGVLRASLHDVVGYFYRVAQHYTQGGFTDECGVKHSSPFHEDIAWWEVLNEMEHALSSEEYIKIYDAVVANLSTTVLPSTKFLGLAMGSHHQLNYYTDFLNRTNHNPKDVRIDGISYHQYVIGSGNTTALAQQWFKDMDAFVEEIKQIEAIKHAAEADIGNSVTTFINEIGCGSPSWDEPDFFLMCAATYTYLFVQAAPLQVEHFGVSQVIGFTGGSLCPGCPDEWPSTSIVNWWTGAGNARYWVLQMLLHELPTGSKRAPVTTVSGSTAAVAAQAFVTEGGRGERKVLLVNKANTTTTVTMTGASGGTLSFVDATLGDTLGCVPSPTQPCWISGQRLLKDSFTLGQWGSAVVTMPA